MDKNYVITELKKAFLKLSELTEQQAEDLAIKSSEASDFSHKAYTEKKVSFEPFAKFVLEAKGIKIK